MKYTVIDLFAGCGGFTLGFKKAGFEVAGFVENWKPAITTHLANFPNSKHIGTDIRKISQEQLEEYKGKVNVVVGSPPCQGFSVCGKRDPKDKRNGLYKEFLRIVQTINPKYVVMENVVGILSMKNSKGELIINAILNDFISLGYLVCYKTLKAVDYGVAQRRVRVIIVGKKCDFYPHHPKKPLRSLQAIQDIPENISGNIFSKTTPEVFERIKRLKQGEKLCKTFNFSRQRIFADKPSPTIATIQNLIHPIEDRFLTPRELARLQGFPDNFVLCGTLTDMIKQVGNAVPPPLAEAVAEKFFKEVEKNEK